MRFSHVAIARAVSRIAGPGKAWGMSHLLAIYLQDHHAGSSVGVALARRAAGANRGNEYGEELAAIAAEIDEGRRALERVMKALDVEPARLKDGAARVAERAGRLKRNGTWLSYSPLSRLVEIEGLETAVGGKQALWDTLACLLYTSPS